VAGGEPRHPRGLLLRPRRQRLPRAAPQRQARPRPVPRPRPRRQGGEGLLPRNRELRQAHPAGGGRGGAVAAVPDHRRRPRRHPHALPAGVSEAGGHGVDGAGGGGPQSGAPGVRVQVAAGGVQLGKPPAGGKGDGGGDDIQLPGLAAAGGGRLRGRTRPRRRRPHPLRPRRRGLRRPRPPPAVGGGQGTLLRPVRAVAAGLRPPNSEVAVRPRRVPAPAAAGAGRRPHPRLLPRRGGRRHLLPRPVRPAAAAAPAGAAGGAVGEPLPGAAGQLRGRRPPPTALLSAAARSRRAGVSCTPDCCTSTATSATASAPC
jgi:hypothetical protein